MTEVKATMAGSVWKIIAEKGKTIKSGEDIAILESMKMEIPITSSSDGVLKEWKVTEGDFVDEGDTIAIIE
ncbi:acetyl-CoA carboxylase biotin carboxyl carrier protein subunit [Sediminibacillus halophilus]|uniref:Acetyl-CoA carboxylase biotin carboxyl carrier protein n=1 Tax=Sediminibacillus halophilus TaxID=482461 RepID=A0A1G9M875_9BACI|nr:acetyl-CoA carboxylase biotin carboxyl carrier protein subunit [Sediminibacillus halophilus]SDL70439.1 acetyl-CoA carboxylase biotin carboxyl carrier protein [Sediminibacillus halophilus]